MKHAYIHACIHCTNCAKCPLSCAWLPAMEVTKYHIFIAVPRMFDHRYRRKYASFAMVPNI